MKRKICNFHLVAKRVSSAIVLASVAYLGSANASSDPDYRPAYLDKGYCGSGSIEITVDGKRHTVDCANLDTQTGRGYFEGQHCYNVERQPYYGGYHYYGSSYQYGSYQHCEYKRFHYQLPVIHIEKLAYDKYHKLISTSHSSAFHFDVWTNGGYGNSFQLKSKQKKYLIVARDYYTISENAPYYKTRIECGGEPIHGQKVSVGIDKPGQQVSCVFHNYLPDYYHQPYFDPQPPIYREPQPVYHEPQACSAWGSNLDNAKNAYYGKCHVRLLDCDPWDGGYMCSSHQIGAYAPSWRR